MKQVRSSATRIKHLMSDRLPDDQDVFGYAGINKSMLMQMIEECSGLIDCIEGKKETFDVIILKRDYNMLSKSCLDYLNALPNEKQADEFDRFLKNIAQIRRLINNTYLLFVKESLRPESELATIRKALEDIVPKYKDLLEQQDSSVELIKEISENHDDIINKHASVVDAVRNIESIKESCVELGQQIQKSNESVEEWTTSIENAEKSMSAHNKTISECKEHIAGLQKDIASKGKAFEEMSNKLSDQMRQNAVFQEEIRNTIGNANRASMAGSFKARSDELDKPLEESERALVLVLVLFGVTSIYLLTSSVGSHGINYAELSIKLPILTPFVWLAWIYTNKVGHLSRIKEDYSFKYAAAMAFEGYKQNCEEGSDLAHRLLELSIENMGANPIRLYGSVQSGPIHEIVAKAKEMVDAACSMGKK